MFDPSRQALGGRGPRAVALGFAALLLAAVLGFAKPYWLKLADQPSAWLHVHAALMTAWCLLLVLQPWWVARGRLGLHRACGRLAWGLAPAIVLSSLVLAVLMTRPPAGAGIVPFRYGLFVLQVGTTLLFGLCVGQALRQRHERALHARWMVASGLLLIDPVFARVFGHLFGPLSGALPLLLEHGAMALTLAAFAGAAWWDRRQAGRLQVFLCVGLLELALQLLWRPLGRWEPWRAGLNQLLG